MTSPTLTANDAARTLGIAPSTLSVWARHWAGRPRDEHGKTYRLTTVDLKVARAWAALAEPGRTGQRRSHLLAEAAIRRDPQPWLLVTSGRARTYPDAQSAAASWLALNATGGAPAGQLINLEEGPA